MARYQLMGYPQTGSQIAFARVATALAVMSVGALAIGALGIGRLAIKRVAIVSGRIDRLSINEVEIGRLRVRELIYGTRYGLIVSSAKRARAGLPGWVASGQGTRTRADSRHLETAA